jgi:hypothetical protein
VAYPAHPTDWDSLGLPPTDALASHTSLLAALIACDASRRCAGIKYAPAPAGGGGGGPTSGAAASARWRLFAGQLMEGRAGGARAAGGALTPPGRAWAGSAPAATAAAGDRA